jgi:protein ImuA
VHGAAAALFAAGILARLKGPVLWCLRARDLFAPALAGAGLDPDRVLYAEGSDEKTVLLCLEEGLRHKGLAAAAGEISSLPMACPPL